MLRAKRAPARQARLTPSRSPPSARADSAVTRFRRLDSGAGSKPPGTPFHVRASGRLLRGIGRRPSRALRPSAATAPAPSPRTVNRGSSSVQLAPAGGDADSPRAIRPPSLAPAETAGRSPPLRLPVAQRSLTDGPSAADRTGARRPPPFRGATRSTAGTLAARGSAACGHRALRPMHRVLRIHAGRRRASPLLCPQAICAPPDRTSSARPRTSIPSR